MPHRYNQPREVQMRGQRNATKRSQEVRSAQRLERIIAVKVMTKAKKKPAEIADALGVNVKTVYRALETLRQQGDLPKK